MAKSDTKLIDDIRQDINNARAVIAFGLDLNDTIINGIWRYFSDVEINVPLSVMPLEKNERIELARGILDEMDEIMLQIRGLYESASSEEEIAKIHRGPLADKVDRLWKELAGCYAEIVNEEIPVLPEHLRKVVAESMVQELADRFDISESDMLEKIRHDSSLRMMFRRTGINPDELY